MARRIVSKLRRYMGDRRHSRRRRVNLPVTISIGARVSSNGFRRPPSLRGHTMDISPNGMALVVPAIRIDEHYLVGENRRLQVKLELPTGPVEMQAFPVRYESLDEHETETGYLVGVRITEMSNEHRSSYKDYLNKLIKTTPR